MEKLINSECEITLQPMHQCLSSPFISLSLSLAYLIRTLNRSIRIFFVVVTNWKIDLFVCNFFFLLWKKNVFLIRKHTWHCTIHISLKCERYLSADELTIFFQTFFYIHMFWIRRKPWWSLIDPIRNSVLE